MWRTTAAAPQFGVLLRRRNAPGTAPQQMRAHFRCGRAAVRRVRHGVSAAPSDTKAFANGSPAIGDVDGLAEED